MKPLALNSMLFLLIVASTAANAQVGTVIGRMTHQGSAIPIAGVLAAVDAPDHFGRHPSNDEGIYRLSGVRAGNWTVEFHCSSANYVGREIAKLPVVVLPDETTILNVEVPQNHCSEPPYSERNSVFQGHFAFGFEYSLFVPCDAESLNLSTNTLSGTSRIWVNTSAPIDVSLKPDTLCYLQLKGTLRGPGNYGHLGVSQYELEVESIEVSSELETKDSVDYTIYRGEFDCSDGRAAP